MACNMKVVETKHHGSLQKLKDSSKVVENIKDKFKYHGKDLKYFEDVISPNFSNYFVNYDCYCRVS